MENKILLIIVLVLAAFAVAQFARLFQLSSAVPTGGSISGSIGLSGSRRGSRIMIGIMGLAAVLGVGLFQNFLGPIVLVLGVFAIAQLLRTIELGQEKKPFDNENITNRENQMNAWFMLIFMISYFLFVLWQMFEFGLGVKGPAASMHGETTDWLMKLNMAVIVPVFFLTNALLFGFSWKYVYDPKRKATYFSHSNKLEMIWTVIPAFVLSIVIILGLKTWGEIMDYAQNYVIQEYTLVESENELGMTELSTEMKVIDAFETEAPAYEYLAGLEKTILRSKGDGATYLQKFTEKKGENDEISYSIDNVKKFDTRIAALQYVKDSVESKSFIEFKEEQRIELYSQQFKWTTRYAGADNKLGDANFKLIAGDNPLGIITTETLTTQVLTMSEDIKKLEEKLNGSDMAYTPDDKVAKMQKSLERLKINRARIKATITNGRRDSAQVDSDNRAYDDIIIGGELRLVINQPYEFSFRAQEVIHSAYFPHFRAQMNCVPGVTTRFRFTPTITSEEFAKDPGVIAKYDGINRKRIDQMGVTAEMAEPGFLLLCNKICGSAHYNMWIPIIVETQQEHDAWLADQKTFKEKLTAAGAE